MSADEQLEALGELGVVRLLLGERGNLERMIAHEGGLHELLLGHGLENLADELALAPCVFRMSAVFLQDGDELLARAIEGHFLARVLTCKLHHGRAAPFARQVDLGALVGDLQRAARLHGGCLDEALREVHHAVKVRERLVGLHRGELGVVVWVHALVAELAANFEDLLETAHEQALQGKLGRDAQEVVAVERVEVRDERLCVRAAQDRMQKRRFDLVEALLLHVAADGCHDLETLLERALDLGVHDKVDIALAITRLLVGQAVELLRQRAQRLGQKLVARDGDGKLAALRAHHGAVHADPVTHVEVFHRGEDFLAERVDAAEQLDVARRVAQLEEGDLALNALGHDAARHVDFVLGGGAVFERGILLIEISQVMRVVERVAVGVLPRLDKRRALRLANLDRVVFDYLLGSFVSHTYPSARSSKSSS